MQPTLRWPGAWVAAGVIGGTVLTIPVNRGDDHTELREASLPQLAFVLGVFAFLGGVCTVQASLPPANLFRPAQVVLRAAGLLFAGVAIIVFVYAVSTLFSG